MSVSFRFIADQRRPQAPFPVASRLGSHYLNGIGLVVQIQLPHGSKVPKYAMIFQRKRNLVGKVGRARALFMCEV